MRHIPKLRLGLMALLLAAGAAQADIIVLKSGRRISAGEVVDEGERYSYETSAGRMSVRKDLVERVERGGGLGISGVGGGAAEIPLAAPRMESTPALDEVARLAVRDGSIDRNYLLRLESEAQSSGRAQAIERVALAHHAAAHFEMAKGDYQQAIGHYLRALTFAPEHTAVLLHLAHLYLQRSEYTTALEYLERARRVQPDSADVAKLMGWAYRGANKIDQAVLEFQRAYKLRPDADVERALEKARRDQQAESEFREGETRHFTLRYHGETAPELARDMLRQLEAHFDSLEAELRYTPPERIGVILYTNEMYFDVTKAPAWTGAVNDGRIRIPVKGLTSGVDLTAELRLGDPSDFSPRLSATLKHELVHSFLHQKTHGRAPVWFHEGLAEWLSGRRLSKEGARRLILAYDQNVALPLSVMEESFMRMSTSVVAYAYAWSMAVMQYIAETHGMADVQRILDHIAGVSTTEQAIRSVIGLDYSDLEAETIKYLRKNFPQ